jgi:hypothetical protein
VKNKRGLSTIISTLLVILLTIVSIALIWKFVFPVISNNSIQLAQSSECLQLSLDLLSAKIMTNPTTSQKSLTLSIKRNIGAGKLSKLKFIVKDNTLPGERDASNLQELETITYTLTNPQDFNINDLDSEKTLRLLPYLKSESGQEIPCTNLNIEAIIEEA